MRRHGGAIGEAIDAGLSEKAAKSIIMAFWAGQVLRKDPSRRERYDEQAEFREKYRKPSDFVLAEKGFVAGKIHTSLNSIDALEAFETHILYGILIDQEFQQFSQPKIRPICIPLSRILYGMPQTKRWSGSLEENTFQLLRQRYRRIKKQEPHAEVRERAITYANQVYAVFERKFKLGTYRKRF